MRRFTDSILFLALFLIDLLAWVIIAATGEIGQADPGRIAPMTVGAVIVIACPALAIAAALGLVRALIGTAPVTFYAWAVGYAVTSAVVAGVANAAATAQKLEVGFGWMTWYFSIQALAFVIALVVALTGGIPGPKDLRPALDQDPAKRPSARAADAPAPPANPATPSVPKVSTSPAASPSTPSMPATDPKSSTPTTFSPTSTSQPSDPTTMWPADPSTPTTPTKGSPE